MPGLRRTTAAKRLSGTARRDREPRPDYIARLTEPPEAPRALTPEARRIWRELASAAVGIGTLTRADLPLLMLLTTTLEQEALARRELVADGNAIAAGSGGRKRHPAAATAEKARAAAVLMMLQFGLSPRARQGIDTAPPPRAANPFILRGRPPPDLDGPDQSLDDYLAEGDLVSPRRSLDDYLAEGKRLRAASSKPPRRV
jgi:P27 family predicted phage terminase small subunit